MWGLGTSNIRYLVSRVLWCSSKQDVVVGITNRWYLLATNNRPNPFFQLFLEFRITLRHDASLTAPIENYTPPSAVSSVPCSASQKPCPAISNKILASKTPLFQRQHWCQKQDKIHASQQQPRILCFSNVPIYHPTFDRSII